MNTVARGRAVVSLRTFGLLVLAAAVPLLSACVQANPATDVGNPVAPSAGTSSPAPSPTPSPGASAVAYTPDLQPIFQSDCVVCHSGSRPSANYSMSTYAAVMRDVQPGSAGSRLVVWTQPGGTMYRFWTGNAANKAAMVRQWVVANNAQQTR